LIVTSASVATARHAVAMIGLRRLITELRPPPLASIAQGVRCSHIHKARQRFRLARNAEGEQRIEKQLYA